MTDFFLPMEDECWNCKQLTYAFLAANPDRKGFAKCDDCVKKMQEDGFVFIHLPYQPVCCHEWTDDFFCIKCGICSNPLKNNPITQT